MTVVSQVQQTLTSLKSAQADLESFGQQTQNPKAKQAYQNAAQQCQGIIDSINIRLNEIKQEEPQYNQPS